MSVSGKKNQEIRAPIVGPKYVALCAHAAGLGPAMYEEATKRLKRRGISLDAINLKGHGSTPRNLQRVIYQDWVDQMVERALFLHSKGKELVLVGSSMGGPIALLSILELQEQDVNVKGLVLINPAFQLKLTPVEKVCIHLLAQLGLLTPKRPETMGGMDYQEVVYYQYPCSFVIQLLKLGEAATLALTKLQETFDGKIVIVQGMDDEIVSVEKNEENSQFLGATWYPILHGTHAFETDDTYSEAETRVINEVSQIFRR